MSERTEVIDLAALILGRLQQQADEVDGPYVKMDGALSFVLVDGRVDLVRLAAEILGARDLAACR